MTLDELAANFKARSETPEAQRVSELLLEWKEDDSTVVELDHKVERYFGHTWIEDRATFDEIYGTWDTFRKKIAGIEGMTMNERLYHFSLFSRYDAGDEAVVYRKLLASP